MPIDEDFPVTVNIGNQLQNRLVLHSTGGCSLAKPSNSHRIRKIHGFLEWTACTVIFTLQIVTNRYMKHYWRVRQRIHTFLGILSLACVLVGGYYVLALHPSNFHHTRWFSYHKTSGKVFLGLISILVFFGTLVLVARRYFNYDFNSSLIL